MGRRLKENMNTRQGNKEGEMKDIRNKTDNENQDNNSAKVPMSETKEALAHETKKEPKRGA